MTGPQVDFITPDGGGGSSAQGSVAQRLLDGGLTANSLRSNSVLRKEEWLELDRTVVQIARQRLVVTQDFVSRNLIMRLGNALGTMVVQHETQSEMTAAETTMDAVTRGEYDRLHWSLVNTPIPIVHKDFQISIRVLEASRRLGNPLDVTSVAEATQQVVETIEETIINGLSLTFGFDTQTAVLRGITTHPDRNTVTLATNWDASAATGDTILADVLAIKQVSIDDRMFGPWMLYVPTAYETTLDGDFKANSDKTIRQRVKEVSGIIDVKVVDKLTANNVVLIQMSLNVMDLIIGMQPRTVEWETQGGMVSNFKVMAIIVPRPKSDQGGRSGIVHLS